MKRVTDSAVGYDIFRTPLEKEMKSRGTGSQNAALAGEASDGYSNTHFWAAV